LRVTIGLPRENDAFLAAGSELAPLHLVKGTAE